MFSQKLSSHSNRPSGVSWPPALRQRLGITTPKNSTSKNDDADDKSEGTTSTSNENEPSSSSEALTSFSTDELRKYIHQSYAAIGSLQRQLHRGEESYFEETYSHGNLFAGWDAIWIDTGGTGGGTSGSGAVGATGVGADTGEKGNVAVDVAVTAELGVSGSGGGSGKSAPIRKMPIDYRWFSSSCETVIPTGDGKVTALDRASLLDTQPPLVITTDGSEKVRKSEKLTVVGKQNVGETIGQNAASSKAVPPDSKALNISTETGKTSTKSIKKTSSNPLPAPSANSVPTSKPKSQQKQNKLEQKQKQKQEHRQNQKIEQKQQQKQDQRQNQKLEHKQQQKQESKQQETKELKQQQKKEQKQQHKQEQKEQQKQEQKHQQKYDLKQLLKQEQKQQQKQEQKQLQKLDQKQEQKQQQQQSATVKANNQNSLFLSPIPKKSSKASANIQKQAIPPAKAAQPSNSLSSMSIPRKSNLGTASSLTSALKTSLTLPMKTGAAGNSSVIPSPSPRSSQLKGRQDYLKSPTAVQPSKTTQHGPSHYHISLVPPPPTTTITTSSVAKGVERPSLYTYKEPVEMSKDMNFNALAKPSAINQGGESRKSSASSVEQVSKPTSKTEGGNSSMSTASSIGSSANELTASATVMQSAQGVEATKSSLSTPSPGKKSSSKRSNRKRKANAE